MNAKYDRLGLLLLIAMLSMIFWETSVGQNEIRDIEVICQQEKIKIESKYNNEMKQIEDSIKKYSVTNPKEDPHLVDETQDWIIDNKSDWDRLRDEANERDNPYIEIARLKRLEIERDYKQALADLEIQCKQRIAVQKDESEKVEKKKQADEAHRLEMERVQSVLDDQKCQTEAIKGQVELERQRIEIQQSLEQRIQSSSQAMDEFMQNLPSKIGSGNSIIIPPGRFDAQRHRWDNVNVKKLFLPNNPSPKTANVIRKPGDTTESEKGE
ncbi:MAG: hypothetical protein NT002_00935 [candidate division Zixibacteria bacterium]|nr:hypothetical protein [candidate division Zixibacteria bacterium]